ncbi:hypothetical protein ASD99_26290 [Mesorhizobium sp. Root695]|jgi:hypothetical protein|nr:hypothetical protein ASD99_26290 [Mesorhizobium sp. Root695]
MGTYRPSKQPERVQRQFYEVAKVQRRQRGRDISRGFANRGDPIVKELSSIGRDMVVDEIMRKWPATVAVMLSYRIEESLA